MPSFHEVIDDLQRVSQQFRQWWEQQNVRGLPDGPRTMRHPTLGVLEFDHVTFQTSITADLRIKVYVASPTTLSNLEQALSASSDIGSRPPQSYDAPDLRPNF